MNYFKKNIFLVDGLGALVSSVMLGLILPLIETGLPHTVLYLLASGAAFFCFYSLYCFVMKKRTDSIWLRIIAGLNLSYALITAAIIIHLHSQMSFLGLAYFIGEILILVVLVWFEVAIAQGEY